MKVLPFCLLVCLLLLQAAASEFANETGGPGLENDMPDRYEKFRRQHVDKKMVPSKCTQEMKRKKIYEDNNVCKLTNTFILADSREVLDVCRGQGVYNNESHYTESKKKFRIVVCTAKKQGRKPKCLYKGRSLNNKVIAVTCQNGYPVHFAEYYGEENAFKQDANIF